MSLKMYFDAGATQAVLNAEKFPGNGAQTVLNLTAFNGTKLGGVYKESKVSHANIAFNNGLGTGFVGLLVNGLVGQRVVHGNMFVGVVASNTDNSVQLSTNYTGAAATAVMINFKKLYAPADFVLNGDVVTVAAAAAANEAICMIPTDTLAVFFGGAAGATVQKGSSIYLQNSIGFGYTALQVFSDDTSLFPYHTTTPAIVFAAGVGTGFAGLPVNGLVGKAVNHNGTFVGKVASNTADSVTIDTAYNGASASAEIYNIGSLEFSLDNVNWSPVVNLADLDADLTVVEVKFRDTVVIPGVAINYPATNIRVSGIEYIL